MIRQVYLHAFQVHGVLESFLFSNMLADPSRRAADPRIQRHKEREREAKKAAKESKVWRV